MTRLTTDTFVGHVNRHTRTCCLYLSNKTVASRPFPRFQSEKYKINGMKVTVQPLVAEHAGPDNGRWKIDLVGLNISITEDKIASVFASSDKPCLTAIRHPSYETEKEMDSTSVKSMLYEKGKMKPFGNAVARWIKAQATFVERSHA